MMSIPHFNSYMPAKKWVPAPPGFEPQTYGSVYPKMIKCAQGTVVDQCRTADGQWLVVIYDGQPNPALKALPADIPKKVRALYLPPFQLQLLRLKDYLSISAQLNAAQNEWIAYWGRRT